MLEEMHTKITSADIYTDRGILSLLSPEGIDSQPAIKERRTKIAAC